ncbi:MAG: sporulation/spore germination protein [Cyanobacteria bacterium Co-bin13]|nr:sporulation/spore germination protein [Cyanobacteria bacterium Co-bin13]
MIHQSIRTPHPSDQRRVPYQYSIARSLQSLLTRAVLGSLLLTSLSSCTPPASSNSAEQSAAPTPSDETEAVAFASTALPSAPLLDALRQVQAQIYWLAPRTDPVTINLYRLDNLCQDFVPESVEVSRQSPIQDAVGRILAAQDFFAFDLAGYRVAVDGFGTANVDLRLHPDSERLLTSLSICEQMALFGSLTLTLQQNPDWNIEQVTFTERGNPLVF